jgi:hypothetical protein
MEGAVLAMLYGAGDLLLEERPLGQSNLRR